MKSRIFDHYITTILGVLLIIATLVLVFKNKATLPEAGVFLTISGGLVFSKDTLFRKTDDTNYPNNNNNNNNETDGSH
jgi:general stress protein CsbA